MVFGHINRTCFTWGDSRLWSSGLLLLLSLRGRRLKGKGKGVLGKGVLGARETRGAHEEGGRVPSSLLPRAWSRALILFPFPFKRLPRRLTINLIVHTMFRYRKRRPRACNSWKWRDWSITSALCEWCRGFSLCNSKTKTSCHTWFNYGWFRAISVCFFLMKCTNMAFLCRLLVWSIGLPSLSLLLIY